MSVVDLLVKGRAAAESLMVDTCTVTRVTGRTLDEDDGTYSDTTSIVYSGKCRIQVRNAAVAALPLSGEREVVAFMLELQTPMTGAALAVGDVVTVTASLYDPTLADRVFRVREVFHKSHATARRTLVQEEQT